MRPPVPLDKGQAVRDLVTAKRPRVALFGGDDATDLDAFDALEALVDEGALDAAVKVGVALRRGTGRDRGACGLVVEGVDGFVGVLGTLASA